MDNKIIKEKQDLTYLSWTKIRNSSGTAGSFLKAYSDFGGEKLYYKLSNYDVMNDIFGHECLNEIVVDRLLTLLGIEHLGYQLIYADIMVAGKIFSTYLCVSRDFKKRGESKIALDVFYELEKNSEESPMDFCKRKGWEKQIYQMLLVDYLILNRDRHGANIEVLKDAKSKEFRLAPLFDHGLSLLYNCQSDSELQKADVLENKRVQCFVGSHSAKENLLLIPSKDELDIKSLKESDRGILFSGMEDFTSKAWREKVWEMIWRRWQEYEIIFNKK